VLKVVGKRRNCTGLEERVTGECEERGGVEASRETSATSI
jgi:hypothetical protein